VTDAMMTLRGLLEKMPDVYLLREMIGFAAQRLMELGTGGPTGAGLGEKSPERLTQRNGYRERDWETRAGTVEMRIPKPRRMTEKVLISPAKAGERRSKPSATPQTGTRPVLMVNRTPVRKAQSGKGHASMAKTTDELRAPSPTSRDPFP
jgi:hypothetical protein